MLAEFIVVYCAILLADLTPALCRACWQGCSRRSRGQLQRSPCEYQG
jgi:hypothetical protein